LIEDEDVVPVRLTVGLVLAAEQSEVFAEQVIVGHSD